MKYIIESNDVIGYTPKYAMLFGDGYMIQPLEDLEVLNSDYINEHFGDLQDTEYQRGLEDAWKAARKIADMWTRIDNDELLAIFGITERIGYSTINSLFGKQTANEAMLNLEAYEEKQEAADKIEIGDEVEVLNSGNKYLIAWFAGTSLCGFAHDGVTCRLQPSDVRKTGRHFDIQSILEDMRHD